MYNMDDINDVTSMLQMVTLEASESQEPQEFIGFEQYIEGIGHPCHAETWTDEDLAESKVQMAKFKLADNLTLADIMERVVVDGRNAIKFKGPQAAENLARHEEDNRRNLEFYQSDYWSAQAPLRAQYSAKLAEHEAKLAAGLYTAEELEAQKAAREAHFRWKNEQPTWNDLYTAEELEEYLYSWNTVLSIDNPQHDPDKLRKLKEETERRKSVWLKAIAKLKKIYNLPDVSETIDYTYNKYVEC